MLNKANRNMVMTRMEHVGGNYSRCNQTYVGKKWKPTNSLENPINTKVWNACQLLINIDAEIPTEAGLFNRKIVDQMINIKSSMILIS